MASPNQDRALEEVFESIKVIDSSLRCYYDGEQHMHRAMAAQLRILFCDTKRKKENSLLARAFTTFELPRIRPIAWLQPGAVDQHNPHLRRLRAEVPMGFQAQFAKMPFVVIEYGSGLAVADIEFEDQGPLLPIADWSSQCVTTHPARVSIRDVIRTVADKGGGAHVDLADTPEFALMRQARPAGVSQHVLFIVALARFALNVGVHIIQLRESGGLDGGLSGFQLDPSHHSAISMARVPHVVKATGAHEYHLCTVRIVPAQASQNPP